jgi:hypothetical protein
MIYAFIADHCGGLPVAAACRAMKVSTPGFYEWRTRAPSARARVDAELLTRIREIHVRSRGTYGSLRVHLELRLGAGIRSGASESNG